MKIQKNKLYRLNATPYLFGGDSSIWCKFLEDKPDKNGLIKIREWGFYNGYGNSLVSAKSTAYVNLNHIGFIRGDRWMERRIKGGKK